MISARRRRGAATSLWPVLASVVLLLAGCTTESAPPEQPPPASIIATVTVPPSSGITITAEQLSNSDPCGLLDSQVLSKFGDAEIEIDFRFTGCNGEISSPAGDQVRISVGFDFDLSSLSMAPSIRHGVTVYRDGDPNWCRRSIVVSPAAAINLAVAADAESTRCQVADAVLDAMLPQLRQGQLTPANHPPNSLAKLDACRLLNHTETHEVPGIDRTQVYPGYNGHHCTWGKETVSDPHVYVAFNRSFPPEAKSTGAVATTIAGRPAVVDPFAGGENDSYRTLPDCNVEFAYRPLDRPSGVRTVELVHVGVSFDGPEKARCELATALATKVAERLPS
ncbi:DUF3558 domain-containing protein [Plantactinospora soyae]|uniref:DUF3558 domain-containing protein n=1 Tax=Plantactinospora soyae TaxID=1544732 RepID=A0A927M507_9ACTN|nr:hypothetical protein [Plantactinospora soyae]MBE1486756.1 hypothetical protein [Plantactinospora soyae]